MSLCPLEIQWFESDSVDKLLWLVYLGFHQERRACDSLCTHFCHRAGYLQQSFQIGFANVQNRMGVEAQVDWECIE